jgi:energy-converting hydrogenase Eha subunit A
MNLAIEQIILFLIMIIALIMIILFLVLPNAVAGNLSTEDKMRQCCQKYIEIGCPDAYDLIQCPCKNSWDTSTIPPTPTTTCDGFMWNYATELGISSVDKVKIFCGCPLG